MPKQSSPNAKSLVVYCWRFVFVKVFPLITLEMSIRVGIVNDVVKKVTEYGYSIDSGRRTPFSYLSKIIDPGATKAYK